MASTMPMEDSLQALLNCNFCKKETDGLKALPCQHTACLPCVRQLKVVRRRFTCDICQQTFPVLNGGFNKLPDSLICKQLRDLLSGQTGHVERTAADEMQKELVGEVILKESDAESDFDYEPPRKVRRLMYNEGRFRCATPTKNITKWQQGNTSSLDEAGANPVNEMNHPNEGEVEDLREELIKASEQAKQGLIKVLQMIINGKDLLKALPEKGKFTEKTILDQQKTIEQECQEKLSGLDKALRDRMEESKSTLKIMEPCVDHIKNVLDSLPSVKLPYGYYRNRKTVEPEVINRALENLERLKKVNATVEQLPIALDELTPGDYVRLDMTLQQAEEVKDRDYCSPRERLIWSILEAANRSSVPRRIKMASNGFSHRRTFSTQNMLETFINSSVNHSSIGRYRGKDYSNGRMCQKAIFPEQFDWQGPAGALVRCQQKVNLPYEGDKVKIKTAVSKPHFGWNGIRHKRNCGVLKAIRPGGPENDLVVIVEFPENHAWKGLYSEIELGPSCGMEAGDEVWVSRSIPEPSRGWAGVNGSSVGKIKSVEGTEGQEEVTVDFPECKVWVGLATELELVRDPHKWEKVQVKLSVIEPKLGWGGSSHNDVGELREITDEYEAYGCVGTVKFPGKPEWPFLMDEIEPARYQASSYEDESYFSAHYLVFIRDSDSDSDSDSVEDVTMSMLYDENGDFLD